MSADDVSAPRASTWGPILVSRHCFEKLSLPSILDAGRAHLSLSSARSGTGHGARHGGGAVRRGGWGALAKSNYAGLRFREPAYRTLRELAISYFEHYFNLSGQKTLRRYSRPVNLKRFDRIGWMTSQEDVWAIPEYLVEIPHTPILTPEQERALSRMDQRLMAAGQVGTVK